MNLIYKLKAKPLFIINSLLLLFHFEIEKKDTNDNDTQFTLMLDFYVIFIFMSDKYERRKINPFSNIIFWKKENGKENVFAFKYFNYLLILNLIFFSEN